MPLASGATTHPVCAEAPKTSPVGSGPPALPRNVPRQSLAIIHEPSAEHAPALRLLAVLVDHVDETSSTPALLIFATARDVDAVVPHENSAVCESAELEPYAWFAPSATLQPVAVSVWT